MALQIKRGSAAEVSGITPLAGEPVWTTDTNVLSIGDGVTPGGIEVGAGNTFASVHITTETSGVYWPSGQGIVGHNAGQGFNADITLFSNTASVRLNAYQGVIVGDGGNSISNIDVNQISPVGTQTTLTLNGFVQVGGVDGLDTIAILNDNGSTHYGNFHNFGDMNAQAQLNSQGTGPLLLVAGSDSNHSGGVYIQSGEVGSVGIYGTGQRNIATFTTASINKFVGTVIDFNNLTPSYDSGGQQPLKIKTYNDDSSNDIDSIMSMRHRGTKATPSAILQGDTVQQIASVPYTGAWADSDVFGWLSGSFIDGYSYGPSTQLMVSQDFDDSPLYFNHVNGYHKFFAWNVPEPEHGAIAQVVYDTQINGNKIKNSNTDFGTTFGGLDSTIKLVPTLSDGTEVEFKFDSTTGDITLPGRLNYDRTFGSFMNTATITPAAANTPYIVPVNVVNTGSHITLSNTGTVTIAKAGHYNIQWSIQLSNTDNAAEHQFDIWYRKNGNNVAFSNTAYDIAKQQKQVSALNIVEYFAANDNFELVYAVSNTALILTDGGAISSPYIRPATPSVILTVVPVGA